MKYTAIVYWNYYGSVISLTFRNVLTGYEKTREYKTLAAAKAAETKFIKKVGLMQNEKSYRI